MFLLFYKTISFPSWLFLTTSKPLCIISKKPGYKMPQLKRFITEIMLSLTQIIMRPDDAPFLFVILYLL